MNQKQKTLLGFFTVIIPLCFALVISVPVSISSNSNKVPPPPLHVYLIFGRPPYVNEWIIAVIEALSLAIMLRRQGFKAMRIFFAWLSVTLFTFLLLYKCCGLMLDIPMILKFIIGEMIVIYLESIVLYMISLNSFFYRERTGPLIPLEAIKL